MAIRPVRLWKHIVDHIEAARFYDSKGFIEAAVFPGHRICKHQVKRGGRLIAKIFQRSGRHQSKPGIFPKSFAGDLLNRRVIVYAYKCGVLVQAAQQPGCGDACSSSQFQTLARWFRRCKRPQKRTHQWL